MKLQKLSLVLVLVTLSLFSTTPFTLAADVAGNTTNIDTSVTGGDVTGNKGDDNATTILSSDANVPQVSDNRDVHNNQVIIKLGGSVSKDIYGGISYGSGTVYSNTVTVNSGGSAAQNIYGGWSSNGAVADNHVFVSGTSYNVFGGWSIDEDATGNTVTINSGGVAIYVAGGFSLGSGNVSNNKVTVETGGTVTQIVYGGRTDGVGGAATNNSVIINGTVSNHVYGGYILDPNNISEVSGNTITVNGTVSSHVVAGRTFGSGAVTNNTTTINATGTADRVYGGWSNGAGSVSDNTVNIHGTANWVYGGINYDDGNVTNNIVNITGTVNNIIYGGYNNADGDVLGNKVTIASTATTVDVYSGYSNSSGIGNVNGNTLEISGTANNVYGGFSRTNGSVSYNTVTITSGGTVNLVYGGYSEGSGKVEANNIIISGTVNGKVYGGFATNTSIGNVNANKVTITSGGVVNANVYGGVNYGDGSVTNNVVEIYGSVIGTVYGGWSDSVTATGTVNGNNVSVSGTVVGTIYAGYSVFNGTVANNSITIESSAALGAATLYGRNNGASDSNMLNVNDFSGDVLGIYNFNTYNFTVGQLNSSLTVLNITGGTRVNINGSNIDIAFTSAFENNSLTIGDVVTVISYINLNATPNSVTVASATTPFIVYGFTETHNTGALLLTVDSMVLTPATSIISKTFAATLAFLTQAADLRIVPTGPLFVRSDLVTIPEGPHFTPFVTTSYGHQHIVTGSSITVKGFSALAGVALHNDVNEGDRLTVGVFVEGGWGDYNSRNSFSNSATIKGKGDTDYYGGGVLASYSTTNGLYSDVSFATGKTSTDFTSWDLTADNMAKYNFTVPYYSAHLTVGQIFSLSDIFELDVYGKYLWTKQKGDTVDVLGYPFKFKDTDSHRLRTGTKLLATVSPQLQPYAGAAFEYEFKGKTKGTLYNMQLDEASLRGGTGIGELGMVWQPDKTGMFKVDLSAAGYIGKREGLNGRLTVSMHF